MWFVGVEEQQETSAPPTECFNVHSMNPWAAGRNNCFAYGLVPKEKLLKNEK